ncbi:MAG: hypothetical protein H7225_11995, partial [Massilia sp.]|nr:hypothetical protein [Aquabacterium sp.]
RFQLALALLKALSSVQHEQQKGHSAEALAALLRTDPLQIEPILETLVELDWVARLDEPDAQGGGRFVLLCDPDQTVMAPLVGRLLLKPDGFTDGFWAAAKLDELTLRQSLTQHPAGQVRVNPRQPGV